MDKVIQIEKTSANGIISCIKEYRKLWKEIQNTPLINYIIVIIDYLEPTIEYNDRYDRNFATIGEQMTFKICKFDDWKMNTINSKFIDTINDAFDTTDVSNILMLNFKKYRAFLDIYDDLEDFL